MQVEIYGNGNAIRLRGLLRRKVRQQEVKRQGISSFSKASRKRMMLAIRSLDFELLRRDGYQCYFATGTYQRDLFLLHGSMEKLKKHLDNFRRAFVRKYSDGFFFWKLEFHRSGVPHLHFLFFVKRDWVEFMKWFNRVWVDTSLSVYCWHSEDERVQKMYRASTNVRIVPLELHEIVSVYCSKEVGKIIQTENNVWGWTGRFWGISNRKVYKQYIRIEELLLSEVEFFRLRRLFRRYLESKGYKARIRYRTQGLLLLFTNMRFLQVLFASGYL